MNKKIWTAALAVCLCALLLLSACGSKEGTETVSGDEAETKALTLAASGESDVLASIYMGTDNMPTITVNGFTDVAADSFCADAVAWAVENGVTNGTSATTFSPNNGCTRAQIVTFLYRAYQGK